MRALSLATAEIAGTELAFLVQVGKKRVHFGLFGAHIPAANEGPHI